MTVLWAVITFVVGVAVGAVAHNIYFGRIAISLGRRLVVLSHREAEVVDNYRNTREWTADAPLLDRHGHRIKERAELEVKPDGE